MRWTPAVGCVASSLLVALSSIRWSLSVGGTRWRKSFSCVTNRTQTKPEKQVQGRNPITVPTDAIRKNIQTPYIEFCRVADR